MEKEQIVKASECCANYQNFGDCDKFPAREGCDAESNFLEKEALSLIREQEKRIEELEKEAAFWEGEADNAVYIAAGNIRAEIASGGTSCHWCENKIKADTVRKMQKMLCEDRVSNDPVVIAVNVIAKELLEETT